MLNARQFRKAAKIITVDSFERSTRVALDYQVKGDHHNEQTELGAAAVGRFLDGVLDSITAATAAELRIKMMLIASRAMERLDATARAQIDRDLAAIYRCMYNEARYVRDQIQELKANTVK